MRNKKKKTYYKKENAKKIFYLDIPTGGLLTIYRITDFDIYFLAIKDGSKINRIINFSDTIKEMYSWQKTYNSELSLAYSMTVEIISLSKFKSILIESKLCKPF